MKNLLGIDHPLVCVDDLAAARARCEAMGFVMTPLSKHPWGTGTTAAIFKDCLLELMDFQDETLADLYPAGDFRFGAFIRDHLAQREGIPLTALNSYDAEADAKAVMDRGVACQGTIEFGRDVTSPDGKPDRTSTTLKIISDPDLPRLSNFICQQHRRDLIEKPEWMEHKNTAFGISRVTILAAAKDQPKVRQRLASIYGDDAITETKGGFSAQTGNGIFVVNDKETVEAFYGPLPHDLATETQPTCISIHLKTRTLAAAMDCIVDAAYMGNTFLVFQQV
jgi:hypothetical protein